MTTRINLRVGKTKAIEVGVDEDQVREWIRGRMTSAIRHFRANMKKPSPSQPFDYPANVSGQMSSNIAGPFLYGLTGRVDMSAFNEDGDDYVVFHRKGTSKMAPRKLVNDALFEVLRRYPEKTQLANAATFGYRGGAKLSRKGR